MSLRQSENHPFDRRKSFRCAVSGPRRHGQLRIGRRQFAVRVLDESVGGFAIETDEQLVCQLGDTLLLEIALAWVEVRVVSIHQQEAATDDPHFDGVELPTRLGLMRVRDVDEWEACPQEDKIFAWRRVRSLWVPFISMNRSVKSVTTTVVALVAAGVFVIWMLESSVPMVDEIRLAAPSGDPAPGLSDRLESLPERPVIKPRNFDKPGWFTRRGSTSANTRSETRTAAPREDEAGDLTGREAEHDERGRTGPRATPRRADPAVLLRPEVAARLALTNDQLQQLRTMLDQDGADRAVDAAPSGAGGLELLTEEQRLLLEQLESPEASFPTAAASEASEPDSAPPAGGAADAPRR